MRQPDERLRRTRNAGLVAPLVGGVGRDARDQHLQGGLGPGGRLRALAQHGLALPQLLSHDAGTPVVGPIVEASALVSRQATWSGPFLLLAVAGDPIHREGEVPRGVADLVPHRARLRRERVGVPTDPLVHVDHSGLGQICQNGCLQNRSPIKEGRQVGA